MQKCGCKVLFVFLYVFPIWGIDRVEEALLRIPEKDREVLETFFQHLIRSYPFGYTLFGDKPMSIACFGDPVYCIGKELSRSLALEKGWKVWTYYNDLFPSQQFIMKREEGKKELFKSNTICLINKRSALKAISDNLDLFRQKLGGNLDPDDILERLCDPKESIIHDDDLLGILLGFGRQNAVIFHRWANLRNRLEAGLTPPFLPQHQKLDEIELENQKFICRFPTNWKYPQITLSPGSAEEFNQICHKRGFFHLPGSDYLLNFLDPPAFVDHGENPELYESYIQTRIFLRKIFNDTSFLEVTLKRWQRAD